MKRNSEEIFEYVVLVDNMREQLTELRSHLDLFILHEDYVLPKKCLEQLKEIGNYRLDDAITEITSLEIDLTTAMVSCETKPEPEEENEEDDR